MVLSHVNLKVRSRMQCYSHLVLFPFAFNALCVAALCSQATSQAFQVAHHVLLPCTYGHRVPTLQLDQILDVSYTPSLLSSTTTSQTTSTSLHQMAVPRAYLHRSPLCNLTLGGLQCQHTSTNKFHLQFQPWFGPSPHRYRRIHIHESVA